MQSTFATVLWVVCGGGIVVGFVALVSSGKAWEDYGKNRLLLDSEVSRGPAAGAGPAPGSRRSTWRQRSSARSPV